MIDTKLFVQDINMELQLSRRLLLCLQGVSFLLSENEISDRDAMNLPERCFVVQFSLCSSCRQTSSLRP